MSKLSRVQVNSITENISSDPVELRRLYRAKKQDTLQISVMHNLVEDYLKDGWEQFGEPLKTKTKLIKPKDHSAKFEDDVWCLLYELGYKKLNIDDKLIIPFSTNPEDTKQIDILAVNDDTILIVECKSSKENKKSPSFKSELEATAHRYEGIIKSLRQIFGEDKKVKYIFATRNMRFTEDSSDLQRLHNIHAYHMNDNAYAYINNLVNKYKAASIYQFMGLLFKGESISNKPVKIPALQGDMGGKKYYMFSIEPTLLLKMGFVLHRTRANEMEFPTYQRLLVPSRLGKIAKYLNEGGYFPNSIIINFNDDNGIRFEAHSRHNDSKSRSGTVVIPNAYGIAYIIDGQHRVYGYAFSEYSEKNTIPVVAFEGLSSNEQLEIFMDINQNQKAVSPSLRLDLEEDLYWDSARLDSRMKALKSSVVKSLANDNNSPLYNLISVGEDSALLTFKPFINALSKSSLIPRATQKKFNESDTLYSLYNVANHDTSAEMVAARKRVYKLLRMSYEYVYDYHRVLFDDEESLIISNRGTYAFICVVSNLHEYLVSSDKITTSMTVEERFEKIAPYLSDLLIKLDKLSDEDKEELFTRHLGAGADTRWLMNFMMMINSTNKDYNPEELQDWNERQDKALQDEGRAYGIEIESIVKRHILSSLELLFGSKWDREIPKIKAECTKRAIEQDDKNHRLGQNKPDTDWTEMFNIVEYKIIVRKFWTTKNEDIAPDYVPFEEVFTIDIGEGGDTRVKRLKWMEYLNNFRNLWSHEGTKEQRLNKSEVQLLHTMLDQLKINTGQ